MGSVIIHRNFRAIHGFIMRWGATVWKRRRRLAAVLGLFITAWMTLLLWPMRTEHYLAIDASPEVLDRNGQPLYVFLNDREQWCFKRDLDAIGPWLIRATVAAEDQRFWRHGGVDPVAIGRAALQNLTQGEIVSGASTLSMQVVKLAGVSSHRWSGKMRQALSALRLDGCATKQDILTAYLNKAPYGLNLVGCEAAARRYYGKPAVELTLPEAALIAALPKAPSALMPLAHPERARARRDYVLRRMWAEGLTDDKTLDVALAAPLGVAWHMFPQDAPHLAIRLKNETDAVRTTLNNTVQRRTRENLRRHLETFAGEIDSGAVLVVDTASAEVLAHVGSPDFQDSAHAGQYDATQARRSPGSTLKPLIYGLAMEEQRLFPGELLLDDTLDFGDYSPKNFDELHHGLVRADAALAASLNIPAVMVFERLGATRVRRFLKDVGMGTLDVSAEHYGVGLALGNCEARLDELTATYAMIANLGRDRPLTWTLDKTIRNETPQSGRCLSAGTCLSLLRALRRPLPGQPDLAALGAVGVLPPLAWKTGTSTGNRDAWAFVFNGHYVVGVWIGNHDGHASPRLVGAEAALPLAAHIFHDLPMRSTPAWPPMDEALKEVEVCALSGLPATPWCLGRRFDLVPRGMYLSRRCDVHWPRPDDASGNEIVERWPGSARRWDLARIEAPIVGEHTILSSAPSAARALQILQPVSGAKYILSGESLGDRVRLSTSLDASDEVHWFIDDRYLGRSKSRRPCFLDLAPGAHKLVATTAQGQTATTHFRVDRAVGFVNFD